jgi:TatD DNase family protein
VIDSHCHFDFDVFDLNRNELWQQCKALGVQALLIPGVEPLQWPRLEQIAMSFDNIFFSVGLHPWWIEKVGYKRSELREQLIDSARHSRCVAIGECGLDVNKSVSDDLQLDVLDLHYDVANTLGLPIILHCVKAHNHLWQTMDRYPNVAGVVHAFTGSSELAKEYTKRGYSLGVGGAITYPRAKKTRRAFSELSADALLLETDAPDMPLFGWQGQVNSPRRLPEILSVLAELRGQNADDISEITTANFYRIFKRASPFR